MPNPPQTPPSHALARVLLPALIAAVSWAIATVFAYPPIFVPVPLFVHLTLLVLIGITGTTAALKVSIPTLRWRTLLMVPAAWLTVHLLVYLLTIPGYVPNLYANELESTFDLNFALGFLMLSWAISGLLTGLILRRDLRRYGWLRILGTGIACGSAPFLVMFPGGIFMMIGYLGIPLAVLLLGLGISGWVFGMLRGATYDQIWQAVRAGTHAAPDTHLQTPISAYSITLEDGQTVALGADGELLYEEDDPPLVELDNVYHRSLS